MEEEATFTLTSKRTTEVVFPVGADSSLTIVVDYGPEDDENDYLQSEAHRMYSAVMDAAIDFQNARQVGAES